MADVEGTSRALKEIKREMHEIVSKKSDIEDFNKFKKSLKYENEKIYETIKVINDNHDKLEEYLDNYLPMER